MMLSASGLDVSSPATDMSQFTVTPIEIRFTGSSNSGLTTLASDGGYINSDTVITRSHFLGGETNHTDPTPLDYSSSDQVIGQGITVASEFHNDSWQLDNTGLSAAVILPTNNGGGIHAADIQPVVLGPGPSMPGVSEGGSIPIHAIFADFHKDSHLASGVRAVASPASESSVESLTSARPLSTPDNAIAGEWARAMVFEIAGGEPTASDLHSLGGGRAKTSDSSETLQHAEPLSSVKTSQQNVKLAAVRHAAGSPTEAASAGEMTQAQAEQQTRQLAAVVTQLMASGKLAAGFSAPVSAAQFSAGNLLVTENPDPAAFASAAVFDQLGEENAVVIESSVEGKSWLRSIGTSPLLMVLALERIAALNSRRAAREARIAAAKKPPRLRS